MSAAVLVATSITALAGNSISAAIRVVPSATAVPSGYTIVISSPVSSPKGAQASKTVACPP